MRFIEQLRDRHRSDLIHEHELRLLFQDRSQRGVQSAVSRCLKSGELVRLKRGIYLFAEKYRRQPLSKFAIAGQLYGPSYISFESALSHYQLIPEAVYATTSACFLNKSKIFKNKFGEFSYQYIPAQPFFLEIRYAQKNANHLIATPVRAMYDLIYARKRIYTTLESLQADLRLDADAFAKIVRRYSAQDLSRLANTYKNTAVKKYHRLLIGLLP